MGVYKQLISCAKTTNCGILLQDVYSLSLLACSDLILKLANSSPCAITNKHSEAPDCGGSIQKKTPDPRFTVHVFKCLSFLHSLSPSLARFLGESCTGYSKQLEKERVYFSLLLKNHTPSLKDVQAGT